MQFPFQATADHAYITHKHQEGSGTTKSADIMHINSPLDKGADISGKSLVNVYSSGFGASGALEDMNITPGPTFRVLLFP